MRDFAQHQVVGGGPGVAPGLAGRLLAGQPQRALLVAVIDVPDPGDHGFAAHDLRREIAAHAIGGAAFARDDREVAQLGFAVEHAHHAVEHLRRRAVDRFERHVWPFPPAIANEPLAAPPLAQPPSAQATQAEQPRRWPRAAVAEQGYEGSLIVPRDIVKMR